MFGLWGHHKAPHLMPPCCTHHATHHMHPSSSQLATYRRWHPHVATRSVECTQTQHMRQQPTWTTAAACTLHGRHGHADRAAGLHEPPWLHVQAGDDLRTLLRALCVCGQQGWVCEKRVSWDQVTTKSWSYSRQGVWLACRRGHPKSAGHSKRCGLQETGQ